jgi:hypothetical protein
LSHLTSPGEVWFKGGLFTCAPRLGWNSQGEVFSWLLFVQMSQWPPVGFLLPTSRTSRLSQPSHCSGFDPGLWRLPTSHSTSSFLHSGAGAPLKFRQGIEVT